MLKPPPISLFFCCLSPSDIIVFLHSSFFAFLLYFCYSYRLGFDMILFWGFFFLLFWCLNFQFMFLSNRLFLFLKFDVCYYGIFNCVSNWWFIDLQLPNELRESKWKKF
jgi:hypothetical protein